MITDTIRALGGVGIFLAGMIWMTDGLRGLAGPALRGILTRFTRTPWSGALTGVVSTAVIQSSSATTITAVGFVSAGLLTFPQALGIIFGANIGTTVTGWIVAILGFKLDLGDIALPLIFIGVMLRLMGGTRLSQVGTALSGFSLLFIGIAAMKQGMAGFEGVVTPAMFPGDSLFGRLQLVLLGVAITVVTQSSSAGVATALAALSAGAINLPQAAALVIGMDVGTTVTAALATIGGSIETKRTGLSHVIYNLLTGIMAFVLLWPFTSLAVPLVADGKGQIALVAFHSGFNILGVILVLPFAGPFARLVMAIVPDSGPSLTRHLDRQLLKDPEAAADAVTGTAKAIAECYFSFLGRRLRHADANRKDTATLAAISRALAETRDFVAAISPEAPASQRSARLTSVLHILDHFGRLYFRCTQEQRLTTLHSDHRLRRLSGLVRAVAAGAADSADGQQLEARLSRLKDILRKQREIYRLRLLSNATSGQLDDEEAMHRLDAMRWLHRVAYHLWRITHHLNRIDTLSAPVSERREAAIAILED